MKVCSVVLLPALKPACSSAMIFSACGFNLFSMIFSIVILKTEAMARNDIKELGLHLITTQASLASSDSDRGWG